MIRGITVKLYTTTNTGVDDLNRPIKTESAIDVENVLVYPASENEILDTLNLTGRKAVYNLCIPKGDTNDWHNKKVEFFGQMFRIVGDTKEYIDDLVPLDWNKQIRCEVYDG